MCLPQSLDAEAENEIDLIMSGGHDTHEDAPREEDVTRDNNASSIMASYYRYKHMDDDDQERRLLDEADVEKEKKAGNFSSLRQLVLANFNTIIIAMVVLVVLIVCVIIANGDGERRASSGISSGVGGQSIPRNSRTTQMLAAATPTPTTTSPVAAQSTVADTPGTVSGPHTATPPAPTTIPAATNPRRESKDMPAVSVVHGLPDDPGVVHSAAAPSVVANT